MMMSVFVGGEGCDRPGRSLRSSDKFGERRRVGNEVDEESDDERDRGGVDTSVVAISAMCKSRR